MQATFPIFKTKKKDTVKGTNLLGVVGLGKSRGCAAVEFREGSFGNVPREVMVNMKFEDAEVPIREFQSLKKNALTQEDLALLQERLVVGAGKDSPQGKITFYRREIW